MKNYILIFFCLVLCTHHAYAMQKKKNSENLDENSKILSLFSGYSPDCLTEIKLSHGNFGQKILPFDEMINRCLNLKKCDLSYNLISIVSLSKNSLSKSQLTVLNMEGNRLIAFELGALIKTCRHLKELNLKNNRPLKTVVWQDDALADPYQPLPVIYLQRTALAPESKKLLHDRYTQYDQTVNLQVSCVVSVAGAVIVALPMLALKFLEQNSPQGLVPLFFGVVVGRYAYEKLDEDIEQQVSKKLFF